MTEPPQPAYSEYGDLTAAQIGALDAAAVELGVDMAALMAVAGWQVARLAWRALGERPGDVRVAAGSGNNGGDALVAARCLHRWGCRLQVVVLAEPERWRWNPLARVLQSEGVAVHVGSDPSTGTRLVAGGCDLTIDGLLGTGQTQAPRPPVAAVIGAMHGPVLAIDVPSGVDASCGDMLGVAVLATLTLTLTLTAMKRGLWRDDARRRCGELFVADVGIPLAAWERCLLAPPSRVMGGELLPVPSLTGQTRSQFA